MRLNLPRRVHHSEGYLNWCYIYYKLKCYMIYISLGILRKSWRVFHDRLLIGRCFWGFVLPVLEYCSAVHVVFFVVSGACFLAGAVFNCNLSHRRSVAVLCMLYKIGCNPMHPLCGALPGRYVPVRVTRGALIAHWYTFAPPRCRT